MESYRLKYFGRIFFRKPSDFSFFLTASVYNFSWWFDGESLIVVLNDVAFVARDVGEEIEVDIYTYPGIDTHGVEHNINILRHVLGLDEDLTEFYDIMSRDALLSKSLSALRGMHFRASTPWIASIIGVCQQNASFRQGWRMFHNIIRFLGRKIVVGEKETFAHPKPFDVSEERIDVLRMTGLGYRAKTLVSIAKLFREREELNRWDVKASELENELLNTRGVGNYTARLVLALSLRDYRKPPIDRWLRRIVSEVYNVDERIAEETYLRIWGKWSGLAALYTTVALDAEPLSKALERIRRGLAAPDPNKFSPLTLWKHL